MRNINRYLVPGHLKKYFDVLFDIKLINNFEIFAKITPYRVLTKSSNNRPTGVVETNIISKVLVTRDINTNIESQIITQKSVYKGKQTDYHLAISKIVIVLNDEFSSKTC